ncbi:MAG: hypothetical protein HUU15_12415 [Candidatus Brocadiae bacterium]|nr:hypothetical protein [Candidatus Brocadiia bacterium]
MSGSGKVPRLVLVASDAGKVTFQIDTSAIPGATLAELLDARDWLISLAGTLRDRAFDTAPLDEEIARRPFDPQGDEDLEYAAEDVAREMLMDEVCEFAPRDLLRYLRAHAEVLGLARAVADTGDVPPLLRQRASCALEALGGGR